jgi:hypothetical protein
MRQDHLPHVSAIATAKTLHRMSDMEKHKSESKVMGRRVALRVLGVGLTAAGGLLGLAGCNKGGEGAAKAPGGGNCGEKGSPDEAAKQLRTTLQYKEKSDVPGKKCSGCMQYEPGKFGDCGGCKLFAGGVSPEGYCLSFAPIPPGGAPTPGKTG